MAAERAAGGPGLGAAGPSRPARPRVLCFCGNPHARLAGLPPRCRLSLWTVLPGTSRRGHLGLGAGRGPRVLRRLAPAPRPWSAAVTFRRHPRAQVCRFAAPGGICCTGRADTREGGSCSPAGWDLVYTGSRELKLGTETDPPFGREVCLPLVLSAYPLFEKLVTGAAIFKL